MTQVTWVNNRGGSGTATGTANWAIAGIALQPGANVITVTAQDGENQTGSDVLTVAKDAAPTVTIASPTSSPTFTTTATTIDLAGTAADDVGVTQVSWVNNRGGSGTASGTASWTATAIPLLQGDNVITVTATDAQGQTGTDILTVTIAPTMTLSPPVINFGAVNNGGDADACRRRRRS